MNNHIDKISKFIDKTFMYGMWALITIFFIGLLSGPVIKLIEVWKSVLL